MAERHLSDSANRILFRTMPVTFCVASHNANEISKVGRRSFVSSQGILDALWQSNENTCKGNDSSESI